MAFIDPNLLQLVAFGTKNDHHIPDGRHLRWFVNANLGFPRSGFTLMRRPSPLPWNPKRKDVRIYRNPMFSKDIEDGQYINRSRGLTLDAPRGKEVQPERDYIKVSSEKLRLRFWEGGRTLGNQLEASWVMLHFKYKKKRGSIAATAVYDDGEEYKVQDRGGAGQNIIGNLDILDALENLPREVRNIRDMPILPTSVDVTLKEKQLLKRTLEVSKKIKNDDSGDDSSDGNRFPRIPLRPIFSEVPPINVDPSIFDPAGSEESSDQWQDGTMLLNGSCIDEVHITGHQAQLDLVEWITIPDLMESKNWEQVDQYFLPIPGDNTIYPAWEPNRSGPEIAQDRVSEHPPKAMPPWDQAQFSPPPATAQEVSQDRQDRYLGEGYTQLADKLQTMLRKELTEIVPQREVQLDALLEPDANTKAQWKETSPGLDGPVDKPEAKVSILDMVLASSLDPRMARLLGLMTTDDDPQSDQAYDYAIFADYWQYQVHQHLAPSQGKGKLEELRKRIPDEDGLRLPMNDDTQLGEELMEPMRIASIATNVRIQDRGTISSPSGFTAEGESRAGQQPPVEVKMSWDPQSGTYYENEGQHVMYALRRVFQQSDEALHQVDPENGVKLPHVPANEDQRQLWDRTPPGLGDIRYKLSGRDIWGRFSDFATANVTIKDEIAPPPPTKVEAKLTGTPDANYQWGALEIAFDWKSGHRQLAQDLSHFSLYMEQGSVAYDFNQWNNAEVEPSRREPIELTWPNMVVNSPIANTTVSPRSVSTSPDQDIRLTITIPDVIVPFDSHQKAQISATVRAHDTHNNTSNYARRAVATRYDEEPPQTPPQPKEPQVATWPDAEKTCYWNCEWEQPSDGVKTQVMRASQIRLLQAEGMKLETYEAKTTTERMNTIRNLAVKYPNVFSPDHERSYDHTVTSHSVGIPSGERTWTVFTVQHISPTGVRSEWPQQPSRFAVISAPETRRPSQPSLKVHPAEEDGKIELSIPGDPSGRTAYYLVYRTDDRQALEDVRHMNLISRTSSDSFSMKDDVIPDTWLAYRAVAVAESGLQSKPTQLQWVRANPSQPPTAPVIQGITSNTNKGVAEVEVKVEQTRLTLQLQKNIPGFQRWKSLPEKTFQEASDVDERGDGTFVITLQDKIPTNTSPSGISYRVVAKDPRGLQSVSKTKRI